MKHYQSLSTAHPVTDHGVHWSGLFKACAVGRVHYCCANEWLAKMCGHVLAEQELVVALKTTFRFEILNHLVYIYRFLHLRDWLTQIQQVSWCQVKNRLQLLSSHDIHGRVMLRWRQHNKAPTTIFVHQTAIKKQSVSTTEQAFARKAWVSARNSPSVSRCTLTSPTRCVSIEWREETFFKTCTSMLYICTQIWTSMN